ncbi:MAG: glutathione S-transferase family protein [Alphaproteobacteria bacterium]|nr:glutathione S-transferase family protein [Alphaproteobacteria bacterium]
MSEIELFSFQACPFAQRTRMALIEKGIGFKLTEVDLVNKPVWFKQLSPHGKVPLLQHNGELICESRIINEYLEEAFPTPALMPSSPLARARARIWADYCDTYFLPSLFKVMSDRKHPDEQKKSIVAVGDRLRFMEHEGLRKLSGGPYWLGAEVSLVDLQYMPFMERLPCYTTLWGVAIPDDCTRLRHWFDAMAARASHKNTVTNIEDHMIRFRRMAQAA